MKRMAEVLGQEPTQMREIREYRAGNCVFSTHYFNPGRNQVRGFIGITLEIRQPGAEKAEKTASFLLNTGDSVGTILEEKGQGIQVVTTSFIPATRNSFANSIRLEQKITGLSVQIIDPYGSNSCEGLAPFSY